MDLIVGRSQSTDYNPRHEGDTEDKTFSSSIPIPSGELKPKPEAVMRIRYDRTV